MKQLELNFDEIDHRLSCGWHTEVEKTGKRKKYLKNINSMSKDDLELGFRE